LTERANSARVVLIPARVIARCQRRLTSPVWPMKALYADDARCIATSLTDLPRFEHASHCRIQLIAGPVCTVARRIASGLLHHPEGARSKMPYMGRIA